LNVVVDNTRSACPAHWLRKCDLLGHCTLADESLPGIPCCKTCIAFQDQFPTETTNEDVSALQKKESLKTKIALLEMQLHPRDPPALPLH
jgi:hypothetical protein